MSAAPGTPPDTASAAQRVRAAGRAPVPAFELTIGADWLTPDSLGTAPAQMIANSTGASPYTYFDTAATRTAAPALHVRFGYRVTRRFTVEAGLLASRGNVQAKVLNDAEQVPAAAFTAERFEQYVVDIAVRAPLEHLAFAQGAAVPFLEGGAGYLRQLHEERLATDSGQLFHAGGGLIYLMSTRPNRRLKSVGLRVDARLYVRNKGYSLGNSRGVFGAVGGGLLLAF